MQKPIQIVWINQPFLSFIITVDDDDLLPYHPPFLRLLLLVVPC